MYHNVGHVESLLAMLRLEMNPKYPTCDICISSGCCLSHLCKKIRDSRGCTMIQPPKLEHWTSRNDFPSAHLDRDWGLTAVSGEAEASVTELKRRSLCKSFRDREVLYMGGSINRGTPKTMFYNRRSMKILLKWMMNRGTPVLGKPHTIDSI